MELWLTLAIVLSNWECKEKKNIIAKRSPYETIRTGQVFLSTFATRNIVIMYIGTLIWCQRRGLFNKISSREERIFYCQWSSYLIATRFDQYAGPKVWAPGSRFFVSIYSSQKRVPYKPYKRRSHAGWIAEYPRCHVFSYSLGGQYPKAECNRFWL